MPDIPKFDFPFQLVASGKRARYVEQDSDEEIMNCVEVYLRTERGSREEVPEYGIPDQAFRQGGASIPQIQSGLDVWEPRAKTQIDPGEIEDMYQMIRINVSGRHDG